MLPDFIRRLLRRWAGIEALGDSAGRSIENPAVPWTQAVATLLDAFGAAPNATGQVVNATTAQRCSAYYGAVRILAETAGSLPVDVYRLPAGTWREPVSNHRVARLLRGRPNPTITGQVFREQQFKAHIDHGNAYTRIRFDPAGQVYELWPLDPGRTTANLRNGQLFYETSDDDGTLRKLFPGEVLHVPLLPEAGSVAGRPMIKTAQIAIGLALATELVGSNWLRQGGLLPFWVELNPRIKFTDPEFTEYRKYLEVARESGKNIFLGETNSKPHELKTDHGRALEWRAYQTLEICRFLGIPPIMLAEAEKGAPKSSVQEQEREFANHTLRPLLTRFEAEYDSKLFTNDPQAGLVVRHDVTELLRADTRTLWWTFSIARQMGILNANEIREAIGRAGYGPAGDQYLSPVNLDRVPRAIELVERLEAQLDRELCEAAEALAADDRRAMLTASAEGVELLPELLADRYRNGRRGEIIQAIENAGTRFARQRLAPLGVEADPRAWHEFADAVSSAHADAAVSATERDPAAWLAGGRLRIDARAALAAIVGADNADQVEP